MMVNLKQYIKCDREKYEHNVKSEERTSARGRSNLRNLKSLNSAREVSVGGPLFKVVHFVEFEGRIYMQSI